MMRPRIPADNTCPECGASGETPHAPGCMSMKVPPLPNIGSGVNRRPFDPQSIHGALRALVDEIDRGLPIGETGALAVARNALKAYQPLNLSERLERMARAADEASDDMDRRAKLSAGAHPTYGMPADYFRLEQAFIAAAGILRAGIDPSEPLREENIRG